MKKHLLFAISIVLFLMYSCNRSKQTKSDIALEFTQDTLNVGYTYWWPESGPFIGECGDELSLVFSGTVTDILASTDEAGPLYKSKKGFVQIDRVFKIKELEAKSFTSQQFFVTDCFDGLELKKNDFVLVFCYDYENDYSIPGGQSILKIDSLNNPLISSVKKYINADQNPSKIKKDLKLWKKHGLGEALERIIQCHENTN